MNNVTFNSPSFGAQITIPKEPHEAGRILKLFQLGALSRDPQKVKEVADAFDKTHPEDVIEIIPAYSFEEVLSNNPESYVDDTKSVLSRLVSIYEKNNLLRFKNLRTGKLYQERVENMVDTFEHLTKNYTELFEK